MRLSVPPPLGLATEPCDVIVHVSPLNDPYQETTFPSIVSTCGLEDDGSAAGSSGRGAFASTASAFATPASATESAVSCELSRFVLRPTLPDRSSTTTTITAK